MHLPHLLLLGTAAAVVAAAPTAGVEHHVRFREVLSCNEGAFLPTKDWENFMGYNTAADLFCNRIPPIIPFRTFYNETIRYNESDPDSKLVALTKKKPAHINCK